MKNLLMALLALGSISAFADIDQLGIDGMQLNYKNGDVLKTHCSGAIKSVEISKRSSATKPSVKVNLENNSNCKYIKFTGEDLNNGVVLVNSIGMTFEPTKTDVSYNVLYSKILSFLISQ